MGKKVLSFFLVVFITFYIYVGSVFAQGRPTQRPSATLEKEATASSTVVTTHPEPTQVPRSDLTSQTKETVEPLKRILDEQKIGPVLPFNFLKYAIRRAVGAGIPPNTIVLLLLLPGIATLIAGARHLVGVRGFGIFLPAALAVTFVATGPIVGIGLFLVIVFVSTLTRILLRKFKVRLQYLPRMAFILWSVVVGVLIVLFLAPLVDGRLFSKISIFPILILALLAEDFTKVQLGKSAKIAISMTFETLVLAVISFFFLTSSTLHRYALLHPEQLLLLTAFSDVILGRYIGLRLREFWRFRKLIQS